MDGDEGGGDGGGEVGPRRYSHPRCRGETHGAALAAGEFHKDVVPNSLYQPITIADRLRSSNMICATPMNTFFPSIRP